MLLKSIILFLFFKKRKLVSYDYLLHLKHKIASNFQPVAIADAIQVQKQQIPWKSVLKIAFCSP